MNLYRVIRPYCSPTTLIVFAESNSKAVKLAHNLCGFASNTTAKLVPNIEGTAFAIEKTYELPVKKGKKFTKWEKHYNC